MYLPELHALEHLYGAAIWYTAILFLLMFPLAINSATHDNANKYFDEQGVTLTWDTYLLWRTSWINAEDGRDNVWRDVFVRIILMVRMCMLAGVLVWSCFRHSLHDVLIDHPVGLQDFAVELRDLPASVSEEEIIEALCEDDPELQISQVLFIESSFPGDMIQDADRNATHSVALVCFHTIAMHDQFLMAHHSPQFFGITHISSYRRSVKTGMRIRDHMCRVLPAGAPCELLYDSYAWQRTKHLNRLSQNCLLLGPLGF
eukprot:TRINITY_DN62759_c0_g1_i1.p1 TRINITY_DN62759_c0_g1~~TRINITY_DN62759_c0_g1_i1.p1  ORF type:complete len:259 (+),score=57.62 TRINITY_DN62759_c0_g1_i1:55-831(+)